MWGHASGGMAPNMWIPWYVGIERELKIAGGLLALFLIYLAFRPLTLTDNFTKSFDDEKCQSIWDYMANFR